MKAKFSTFWAIPLKSNLERLKTSPENDEHCWSFFNIWQYYCVKENKIDEERLYKHFH